MIVRFGLTLLLRWLPLPVALRLIRRDARWWPRGLGFPPRNCVEESLLAIARAARRGGTMMLAFGVKKEAGRLVAHAWAESPDTTETKVGFVRIGSF